jgi:hypothetical protein
MWFNSLANYRFRSRQSKIDFPESLSCGFADRSSFSWSRFHRSSILMIEPFYSLSRRLAPGFTYDQLCKLSSLLALVLQGFVQRVATEMQTIVEFETWALSLLPVEFKEAQRRRG